MFCFEAGGMSDIGNNRESNQDRCVVKLGNIKKTQIAILCVADGMGGLSEGEFASETAMYYVDAWWGERLISSALEKEKGTALFEKIQGELDEILYSINEEILQYSKGNGNKIGTTFSLLFFFGREYYMLHVGDSRIYRIGSKQIEQLSRDDTWIQDQIEKGYIEKEEAETHPKKNILTNCLGVYKNPSFQRRKGKAKKDDCFLLCSDGLYSVFDDSELFSIIEGGKGNIEVMIQNLIQLAKRRCSTDNITVIINKMKKIKNKPFLLL